MSLAGCSVFALSISHTAVVGAAVASKDGADSNKRLRADLQPTSPRVRGRRGNEERPADRSGRGDERRERVDSRDGREVWPGWVVLGSVQVGSCSGVVRCAVLCCVV